MTPEPRDDLAEALWQAAVRIEDGGLNDALARMRQAQEKLSEAIRNGASPDEIQKLMDELKAATDAYTDMLAERGEDPADRFDRSPRDGQSITGDQIQQMMDEIQRLMNEGRMAEAQELLQQFNRMMENLQVTQGQGGEGRDGPSRPMQRLTDTLEEQQKLADEAMRQAQDNPFGMQDRGRPGGRDGGGRRTGVAGRPAARPSRGTGPPAGSAAGPRNAGRAGGRATAGRRRPRHAGRRTARCAMAIRAPRWKARPMPLRRCARGCGRCPTCSRRRVTARRAIRSPGRSPAPGREGEQPANRSAGARRGRAGRQYRHRRSAGRRQRPEPPRARPAGRNTPPQRRTRPPPRGTGLSGPAAGPVLMRWGRLLEGPEKTGPAWAVPEISGAACPPCCRRELATNRGPDRPGRAIPSAARPDCPDPPAAAPAHTARPAPARP